MRQGTCVNFNGLNNSRCDADHRYKTVAGSITAGQRESWQKHWAKEEGSEPTPDWALSKRIPCFEDNGIKTCADCRYPTAAEVEEFDKRIDDSINVFLQRMKIVRPMIVQHIEQNGRTRQFTTGSLSCPICESGEVHYTYHGHYNRHIQATCTTKDCVEWIE